MATTTQQPAEPYALDPDDGTAIWFAGSLVTIKATGEETNGSFSLVEQLAPAGFGPPLHVHHEDDEMFVVLEGAISVWLDDEVVTGTPGSVVYLPHGVPHTFRTEEEGTRIYQLAFPAGFEQFFEAVGEPAPRRELPPPTEPDVEAMAAVSEEFGFEFLGPPPWLEE